MSNNNNKGLLDKKRQAKLADEWKKELRGLSREEGIKIFESLVAKNTLNEFAHNFSEDHPLSMKLGLKKWAPSRKSSKK